MNWIIAFFIAFVLAWAGAQDAHAGRGVDLARGQAIWDAAVHGRTTTIGTASGPLKIYSPMGTATAGAAGASKVSGSGTVPVADKNVPLGFTGEVAKDAIVGGAVGVLTGGVIGGVIGAGAPLLSDWLNRSNLRQNPQTGAMEKTDELTCTVAPCYQYYISADSAPMQATLSWNSQTAGVKWATYRNTLPGEVYAVLNSCTATVCTYNFYNKQTQSFAFSFPANVTRVSAEPSPTTWSPATAQQVEDLLRRNDPPPGVVDELSKLGNITWPLGNVKVSGPSEVKGPKSTSTTRSGNRTDTTISQESVPLSYSGPDVTAGNPTRTSTTTSTTTNPDGSTSTTTSTTTETSEQGTEGEAPPKPEDQPPTDTALPPVPDLYVRKYPNGMEGIYDQYKDQLKNTSLVQLARQLMPNVGDGGQCPSWPMNFNLAVWASYGTYDVAPPCWIWGVAKAILILSALLLARALIFGG